MRTASLNDNRFRRRDLESSSELYRSLAERVVGQPEAVSTIIPYVQMFQSGLSPEGRPAGVFLLLGPSGTGKTRTVESLAEVLHGSRTNVLKIDCGEFQMEHEVAKLIGAPPGYLGHRETTPMLNQNKLNATASERCGLSIVLFDEIEKAASSLARLLLGVLDKATLRLGDNTTVNFENSLIFLTSNLGARDMVRELMPDFGFQAMTISERPQIAGKLKQIGLGAVRRKFSPEFVNRLDAIITYQPLTAADLNLILTQQIRELQAHILKRLGRQAFLIEVEEGGRQFLLRHGTSPEYGARELKRTIHRHLTQPIAAMVANGRVDPGATVVVGWESGDEELSLRTEWRGDGPDAGNRDGQAYSMQTPRLRRTIRRPDTLLDPAA
jgi:ATP-dependent Clp protease ATP-binding subunit ClpA